MWHLLGNSLPCWPHLGILYLVASAWEFSFLWPLLGNSFTLWHLLGKSLPCGICLGSLYLVASTCEFFILWHLLWISLPCCICLGILCLMASAWEFSALWNLLWNSLSCWPLLWIFQPCGLRGALVNPFPSGGICTAGSSSSQKQCQKELQQTRKIQ